MKRDWDKLRRQDRARPQYDPIASFHPPRQRRSRRFKKLALSKPKPLHPAFKPAPSDTRILQAVSKGKILHSTWVREYGRWRCTQAPDPIEWFTRLVHPHLAKEWLLKHHFQFNWLTPEQALAKPDAGSNMASEETPADSYTANAPSHAPAVNTVPSLNNDTQAVKTPSVTEVVKFPAASPSCTGAEWLHHSLPLNTPAEQATPDSRVPATA